ncbi:helix-turn-helix transcriptional regulator [Streptomyces sp. SP2-10]|uniref:helix-turn-helix domain-containing protein n=1 Tax=Streptomyces sp. SP2-10 TaxID=2873385 RepID=UPI0027E1B224|nr:helix-turn-helix transcriptional regulator [Streptomyces sp. SP2-10]
MSAQGAAFGALLRELRLAKSLTIEALAEASGVSVRGIGDLERGRRAAPQRRTVAALADGLALDAADRERLLAAERAERTPGYNPVGVRSVPRGIDDFVTAGPQRPPAGRYVAQWPPAGLPFLPGRRRPGCPTGPNCAGRGKNQCTRASRTPLASA